jgi:glutathione synthase
MRKDPPMDADYILQTNLLSFVDNAFIVNSPYALREFNEKLITLNFSRLIPDTLVSSDLEIIEDFIADHDRAILKPLCNKHEGLGVLVMQQGNKNLRSVVELLTNFEERPIMVQEFIGDAKDGDKRVIMVNGKIIDFIKRVPPEDDYRASPTSGGSFIETDLTEHDKFICNSLSDFLLSNGIHLAGIDIIEGKLMQINITSPTSLPDIDRLRNLDGEHKIERKVLIELLNYSEKYKK